MAVPRAAPIGTVHAQERGQAGGSDRPVALAVAYGSGDASSVAVFARRLHPPHRPLTAIKELSAQRPPGFELPLADYLGGLQPVRFFQSSRAPSSSDSAALRCGSCWLRCLTWASRWRAAS